MPVLCAFLTTEVQRDMENERSIRRANLPEERACHIGIHGCEVCAIENVKRIHA